MAVNGLSPGFRDIRHIGALGGLRHQYRDILVRTIYSDLDPSKPLALPVVPLIHIVRHNFPVSWMCGEDSQGSLDQHTRSHWHPSWVRAYAVDRTKCTVMGTAGVNEARHRHHWNQIAENIPPTQAMLFQRMKRALLQSSFYGVGQHRSSAKDVTSVSELIQIWRSCMATTVDHHQQRFSGIFSCIAVKRHARKGDNTTALVLNAQHSAKVKAGAFISRAVMISRTYHWHHGAETNNVVAKAVLAFVLYIEHLIAHSDVAAY